MKKQTAVQWLVEQLKEYDFADIKDNDYYIIKIPCWVLTEKKEQAKQMEKKQIKKAYKDFHDLGHIYGLDTEQYYNENFNAGTGETEQQ